MISTVWILGIDDGGVLAVFLTREDAYTYLINNYDSSAVLDQWGNYKDYYISDWEVM